MLYLGEDSQGASSPWIYRQHAISHQGTMPEVLIELDQIHGPSRGTEVALSGLNFRLESGELACIHGGRVDGLRSLGEILAGRGSLRAGSRRLSASPAWVRPGALQGEPSQVEALARLPGIQAEPWRGWVRRLGLEAWVGAVCSDLPGWAQQRLALALAFSAEASIWVFQDPLACLDWETLPPFEEAIREQRQAGGGVVLLLPTPGLSGLEPSQQLTLRRGSWEELPEESS